MSDGDEYDADSEALRKKYWGGSAGAGEKKAEEKSENKGNGPDPDNWGEPYMGVLHMRRRGAPELPLEVFGETWKQWLTDAAAAAACPVDYVVAPLLASVSTLIGNARWAQAWPGWAEPPHLWEVVVGDSGTGKSPGADCLMRDVLPTIERRMIGDYPDRLHEWQAAVEFDKLAKKRWKDEFREAQEKKKPLPPIPKPTAVLAPFNPVRAPAIGLEPESAAGGVIGFHPHQPAGDLVAHNRHAFRRRGGEKDPDLLDRYVVLAQTRLFRRDVRRRRRDAGRRVLHADGGARVWRRRRDRR